jgi:hypothetical protein
MINPRAKLASSKSRPLTRCEIIEMNRTTRVRTQLTLFFLQRFVARRIKANPAITEVKRLPVLTSSGKSFSIIIRRSLRAGVNADVTLITPINTVSNAAIRTPHSVR